ncbi:class I SAM-dependent methyltransferase [Gracilibacillus halotolerans]|nr:class I SAM-dependent methyltransferase [Gracilibacillus halotolerans]
MSEQYFSSNPNKESKPQHWTFTLRGFPFTFYTDAGVFSKKEVDYGSRVLIETFEAPNVDGGILDIGCGYGPISLALAKSFQEREVVGVDVNRRALALAQKNAAENKISNASFLESDITEAVKESRFASVVTNPPIRAGKKIVHAIFREAKNVLKANGELWVVIQKKQGAPSAKKELESIFDEVETVKKDKGYYILRAKTFDATSSL